MSSYSAVPAAERGAETYRFAGIRDAVPKSYWLGAWRLANLGARLALAASWSATVRSLRLRRVRAGGRRRSLRLRRVLDRRRRDGRRAAFSDNEDLDPLRVVTDDKIVTGENAGQNLFQGTRKSSADDFVQRRGATIAQTDILAEDFKNMTHDVVLDPHMHLVAIALNSDLGIRLNRRKSR